MTDAQAPDDLPTRGPHWPAAVPLVIGLLGMLGSWRLDLGSLSQPAPGQWPFFVSTAIVLCSVPLLLTRSGAAGTEAFGRDSWQAAAGVLSILAFALVFERTGFLLPAMGLLLFWCRVLGKESWRMSLPVAVMAPAVTYLLFGAVLSVPFPDDVIAFWS